MGAIENISKNISRRLGDRLNKSEEEKSILNYGLFVIIHTSIAMLLTIIVGIITNTLLEIIIITISASWMKRYSGGVHARTPNRCLIIGTFISFILALINKQILVYINNIFIIIFMLVSVSIYYIILYKRCPVGTKNKPLKSELTRKKLRKKAFNLINLYTLIMLIGYLIYIISKVHLFKVIVTCIWLGLGLQILVLTKVGEQLIMLLDYILQKLSIS